MKNQFEIVVWRDTPVRVKHKTKHIKKYKQNYLNGFWYTGFILDYGDLPGGRFNDITGKFEPCVNNRGYGYANRKALKYRKNKKNY
jgi:hypothetical protein